MKIKKITVLYNLPGTTTTSNIAEADEDTQSSALEVNKILNKLGYESSVLGIKSQDINSLKSLKTDFVFNLIEWSGRESHLGVKVIKALDKAKIPYSGSHADGYKISCDKVLMKKLMVKHKIPTPNFKIVATIRDVKNIRSLKFPVIVKPIYEHCGIGISQSSVATNMSDLKKIIKQLLTQYHQPVLAEELIMGQEAHITVIEKKGQPYVLPPAVMTFKKQSGYWPVLTYESKWQKDHWEGKMSWWDETPLPVKTARMIKDTALKCYHRLGGRGYPRIDMRIRDGKVYVLEINNNPGIGDDWELGITYSMHKAHLTFPQLLQNIVKNSLRA